MDLKELSDQLQSKTIEDQIGGLAGLFPGQLVFTTSFGMEDQVITHLIFENNIPVEVVTIDTGRLFHETYMVFDKTVKKYNKKIRVYSPDQKAVEEMMTSKGPFSFYYSKEDRLECCNLRKVIQLNRALDGKACWISGIRAAQSGNRSKMSRFEYDKGRKLIKFYPLFDWSYKEVVSFAKTNNIPYNILHDNGFDSIGCKPCTRAVSSGDDFRSGRWWWETDGKKECGLHLK